MSHASLDYIDIEEEKGSIQGYAADSSAEQLPNWLSKQGIEPDSIDLIVGYVRENCSRFAIMKNLNVEENGRGQGIGGQLLEEAISQSDSDLVMLVSDLYETQKDGFILQKFYERRDFETVLETGAGPLMVYPSEQAAAIKNVLEKNHRKSQSTA